MARNRRRTMITGLLLAHATTAWVAPAPPRLVLRRWAEPVVSPFEAAENADEPGSGDDGSGDGDGDNQD